MFRILINWLVSATAVYVTANMLPGITIKSFGAALIVARARLGTDDAKNLSLDLKAGGCFCERWESSSVEHARVVAAMPGALLRLHGALGPLQEMAVFGSLSFALKADGAGTVLTMTYRVSGDSQHQLDRLESAVAGVIESQITRLERFIEAGSPE
jgi:hypothetical protein